MGEARMRHGKVFLLIVLGILAGCVSETRKANGDLVEDKPPSNGPTPVEQVESQVRKRIDHMKYEKGTELLKSLQLRPQRPLVVMSTGFGSVESAVECMRNGAFDYLIKPYSAEQIEVVLKKADDAHKDLG